ncbi:hypothetical protein D921_02448 [Enterococcus faecalis F01966]|nr:hypothetical protein D921_02448 [Enterococcus faecalis F01966]
MKIKNEKRLFLLILISLLVKGGKTHEILRNERTLLCINCC